MVGIANSINSVLGTSIKVPDFKIPQSAINAGVAKGQAAANAVAAATALGVSSRTLPTTVSDIRGMAPAKTSLRYDPVSGGFRASGGPVSAGGSYIVGERGPEMLTMGGNGYVTPNNKLGATIVFNLNSVVSLADMENAKRVLQPIVESGLRTVMAR